MDKKKQKRKVSSTTMSDVLTEDNVKDALNRILEERPNITDLVCVFRDREGAINWKCTSETTIERVVSMLEIAKMGILVPEEGEEEE